MDAGIQRVEDRADLEIGQLALLLAEQGQAGFVVAVELQLLGGCALTLSSSLSWQLC